MQKAWNIPDLPVYSLATYGDDFVNMNICTYVTAISMKPKLYGIAVYENTKTLSNIQNSSFAVLQLLHFSQYNLVNKLGKQSGFNFDKHSYLEKRNLTEIWMNYQVLKNVSARILLKKMSFQKTGDHVFHVFEVIKSNTYHQEYLRLNVLRDKKIIRG